MLHGAAARLEAEWTTGAVFVTTVLKLRSNQFLANPETPRTTTPRPTPLQKRGMEGVCGV